MKLETPSPGLLEAVKLESDK